MKMMNVAVLGATGTVGQRFIELLQGHPYFNVKTLLASDRTAGKPYHEVCTWLVSKSIPESVKEMPVQMCSPETLDGKDIDIVFSALPSDVAKEVEPKFAKSGYKVFSNASAFRMEKDVPLVVAEVNAQHMNLIRSQRKNRKWSGFIVTNPNCSTIIMVLVLKPLYDAFGIKSVAVSTMQAISGAGYPGVASLDILDNILPYIKNEEKKMESEPLKLLGTLKNDSSIINARLSITASCHRVPTIDGHLESLQVSLGKDASTEEVKDALRGFGKEYALLPTSPGNTIVVTDDPMRPQPKLDRNAGGGMSITVGRVRKDRVFENGVKMVLLGHNTIRGAAGQSIQNAEWWVEHNRI